MSTSHHRHLGTLTLAAFLCLSLAAAPAADAQSGPWLEPQGLNIVDIAGQVPDAVLSGLIIAWHGSGGIVRFQSSDLDADWLRIHVLLNTRRVPVGTGYVTQFSLLGQAPLYDHMTSTSPESWVRVYEGGREITSELSYCSYIEPPRSSPTTPASDWNRYPANAREIMGTAMVSGPNGRWIPANTGGSVTLPGDRPVLTATFTVRRPSAARVTYLGTQEASFQSFIGPVSDGDMGAFAALYGQISALVGTTRHTRIPLVIPGAANYVMFNYAPSDFDIYSPDYSHDSWTDPGSNFFRPIAGTIRLAPDEGMLSQNLNHGGAFPLRVAWQDADQSAGPYLSLLPPVDRITPPEFFVLPGTPYNPCFREGGCSADLLNSIINDREPLQIIYLQVTPSVADGAAFTLQAADETYRPLATAAIRAEAADPGPPGSYRVFVPTVRRGQPQVWAGVQRPAGIVEPASGRMVSYIY